MIRWQLEVRAMSGPALQRWTVDQFFEWQARQTERYELVGGFPVRMMAGARNVHDDIVVNLLAELRAQLRGSGCRPFTGDGSIETMPGQIRRPDIGVDSGRRDPNGLKAALPRMVAEVLSPTTRDFDSYDKRAEYEQVDSLDYIMLVDPNVAYVDVWSRGADRGWNHRVAEGLETTVPMPTIGVTLALAEIYEGVEFPPPGPRLVRREEPPPG
jgi:Uma2 family endonuclease